MNKSELMATLNSEYYLVFAEARDTRTFGDNLKYYKAIVFDEIDDVLRQRELYFYVENEGQGNEVAHWDSSEPKPTTPISFNEEVSNYIQNKIDAGAIEGAFVDNIDSIKKIAIGKAIINNAGTLSEKKVFIDKDINGNLRHRVIG